MLPSLAHLLSYKNPNVVTRFKREFPHYQESAEQLFENMLKYLWICKKHSLDRKANPQDEALDFVIVMHLEMQMMDDMWHNFILHTRDYAEFCQNYFGEFVHHVPSIVEQQPEVFKDFEIEMTRYLSYVYDHLGEKTVRSWFSEHLN